MNIEKILNDHYIWLSSGGEEGIRANLSEANLSGAILSKANLFRANLSGADLSEAYLYLANLYEANLYKANLYEANLSGADLSGANLSKANLSKADLSFIEGKDIFTFSFNKNFGYYCDGYIKIGCKYMNIDQWIEKGERIGIDNSYSKTDISRYLKIIYFIKEELL